MSSNLLKKTLFEFVYGGHLLSLGSSSIVLAVMILAGVSVDFNLLFLAYLISQIVYNNDHLKDSIKSGDLSNKERAQHLLETRKRQSALLFLYIILFITIGLFTNVKVFLLALTIVTGGVLYTFRMKHFTQKIIAFKNIYIAFFWSLLAFLVFLNYQNDNFLVFLIFAFYIFVRWIINSSYFDIKDLSSDRAEGLKTLPAVLGLSKTIFSLHILNIISGLIIIVSIAVKRIPPTSIVMLAFILYSFIYLYKTKSMSKKQLRIFSYVMVDGEYLLWPLFLIIGKMLL